jgi:hypothetical protein
MKEKGFPIIHENKKSTFALVIYVVFILLFQVWMGLSISDIWDRYKKFRK